VWDLGTGSSIGKPLTGHTHPVAAVATTVLDGRPVAVTGSWDKTVRVWDLGTGRPIGKPLTGHTHPVRAVATTVLDGRPVAVTGSADRTVRVWDLGTGNSSRSPLPLIDSPTSICLVSTLTASQFIICGKGLALVSLVR
jgi:WD40 repeat protein